MIKGKQSSVLLFSAMLFCAACSNHAQSNIDAPEDQAYCTIRTKQEQCIPPMSL